MSSRFLLVFIALLSIFALVSCDIFIPSLPGITSPLPTTDPQQAIDRAVTETLAAETLIAGAVQATLQAMVSDTPQPTFTPSLTYTPTITPSFTLTTSPTFTLTPPYPTVTVSAITNCRTGPGRTFDLVATLQAGDSTQVVARTTAPSYLLVRTPGTTSGVCWLWDEYATIQGDLSILPAATPPPTPTPAANITIAYLGVFNCMGSYGFRFQLTNNGSTTWESYRVDVTDTVTSTTRTFQDDEFTEPTPTCVPMTTLIDLEPGEIGTTGNWGTGLFSYYPAGHAMTAIFRLCSQNGLAGACLGKSINFTPTP